MAQQVKGGVLDLSSRCGHSKPSHLQITFQLPITQILTEEVAKRAPTGAARQQNLLEACLITEGHVNDDKSPN